MNYFLSVAAVDIIDLTNDSDDDDLTKEPDDVAEKWLDFSTPSMKSFTH